MYNKKEFIIGIITTISIFSIVLIILFTTDIISFNSNSNNDSQISDNNKISNDNNYKEYKINDEITLSDGSKWIVIKNSPTESDYVTLIAKESKDITDGETYNLLFKEIFKTKINYNKSELKKYVESLANDIPIKLKEVDGYKIRLITVDEILSIDKDWKYDDENEEYDICRINNDKNKM